MGMLVKRLFTLSIVLGVKDFRIESYFIFRIIEIIVKPVVIFVCRIIVYPGIGLPSERICGGFLIFLHLIHMLAQIIQKLGLRSEPDSRIPGVHPGKLADLF